MAKNSGSPPGNLQNQGLVDSFVLTSEARTPKHEEGEALVRSLNCLSHTYRQNFPLRCCPKDQVQF